MPRYRIGDDPALPVAERTAIQIVLKGRPLDDTRIEPLLFLHRSTFAPCTLPAGTLPPWWDRQLPASAGNPATD